MIWAYRSYAGDNESDKDITTMYKVSTRTLKVVPHVVGEIRQFHRI